MADAKTRRGFFKTAASLATAGALSSVLPGATAADWSGRRLECASGTPPTRPAVAGRSNLKLSCNLYSYHHPLQSGAMTLEEVIAECAEIGFDAVDPTGYYFPGYPDPPPNDYVHRTKRDAFLLGLDVSGTGVRNDFTAALPEERVADIEHVKRWVDVAANLDAPVLRVFAGAGVPEGHARDAVFGWVVEALRDVSAFAGSRGVMIVLQNHDELIKTADELLDVHGRINSDWFGLNVDIGSLRTGDPYEEIARLAPHAATWQIKENVYRRGVEEKTDVARVVSILRASGYRGYIPLETLGPGDEPRKKLPAFFDEVRRAVD